MHTNTSVGAEVGISHLLAILLAHNENINLGALPAVAADLTQMQPGDGSVHDPVAFAEVMAEAKALIDRTVMLAVTIRSAMDERDQADGSGASA